MSTTVGQTKEKLSISSVELMTEDAEARILDQLSQGIPPESVEDLKVANEMWLELQREYSVAKAKLLELMTKGCYPEKVGVKHFDVDGNPYEPPPPIAPHRVSLPNSRLSVMLRILATGDVGPYANEANPKMDHWPVLYRAIAHIYHQTLYASLARHLIPQDTARKLRSSLIQLTSVDENQNGVELGVDAFIDELWWQLSSEEGETGAPAASHCQISIDRHVGLSRLVDLSQYKSITRLILDPKDQHKWFSPCGKVAEIKNLDGKLRPQMEQAIDSSIAAFLKMATYQSTSQYQPLYDFLEQREWKILRQTYECLRRSAPSGGPSSGPDFSDIRMIPIRFSFPA